MPWRVSTVINERTEFALKALQEGVNFSALCKEYGISRKTGYKFVERYRQEGLRGMSDLSRRPQSSPNQLGEDVLLRIVRLHDSHPAWGPKKIRAIYLRQYGEGPSESSFKRVFEKAGWVRKRKRKPQHTAGRLHSAREAHEPNDIWSVDFKGWWHTNDGSRCEPLTVRDEKSRYILEIQTMQTGKTEAVRAVFERLFEKYGLPKAIRSDNGAPFASSRAVLGLTRLSAWWVALGIDLERGRPGKPQDNGAHERMHRDISDELEKCAKDDLGKQQAAFDVWRESFNKERPHEALGMRTPAEVYRKSERKYEGTPADIAYEMMSRRVKQTGEISLHGKVIALSSVFAGWSVGLEALEEGRYGVYFAELRIGEIDLNESRFLPSSGGGQEEEEEVS
jgi:putative transposase